MKINVKEEGFFSGYGIEKKDIFFILILILIAIFGFSFNAKALTGDSLSSYLSDNVVVLTPISDTFYFPANTFDASMFTSISNQPGNNRTLYPYKIKFAFNDETLTDIGYSGSAYFIESPYGSNMFISPVAFSTSFLTTSSGSYILSHGYGEGVYVLLILNNASAPIASAYFSVSASGEIVFIENPNVVGLPDCGSDDGLVLNSTPTNLCNNGQADIPVFDGIKWDWSCSSGQVSEVCRAYSSTSNPINGSCGEWDGQDFDVWPDTSDLCDISASLIFPSMLETINSYTWTCSGFNGGISAYCSADKTTPSVFPELPAGSIDDCSSLGIPEVWFCNISNTIKSIFLPSADKITELNETINKISGRFPFSYINSSMSIISDISNNISEEDSLSLSIMGSESNTLYFEDIPFVHYIKIFTTILMSFLFIFWLIRFIKDIF